MAAHLLEEATEDIVVVKEVAPRRQLVRVERSLQLEKETVEALQYNWSGARRQDTRAALDNLQPLFNVDLQS